MTAIFISYRRSDAGAFAGRIYDYLSNALGADQIFKDTYDISPGDDFRGSIREEVARCNVLLVLIGNDWVTVSSDGGKTRRLDSPDDWVRIEVETGLQRQGVRVIPILLGNTSMPTADDLPVSLRELAFRNAQYVRDDPDFKHDTEVG